MGEALKPGGDPLDNVIIYAGDGGCYWREGGCGYTSAAFAGVFTREEATRLTSHCGPEKLIQFHPVPEDHVPTLKARIAELEAERDMVKADTDRLTFIIEEANNARGWLCDSVWDDYAALGDAVEDDVQVAIRRVIDEAREETTPHA